MSLKNFHIFFILTAIALLGFLSYWFGQRVWLGQNTGNLAMFLASLTGLIGTVPYLAWFLQKSRTFRN